MRLLGVDDAIAFLLAFGGAELYLPRRDVERSPAAELLGVEAARKLGAAADRLSRRVPTAKPWIAAVWHARGQSATQIARVLHVSDVAVRGWLKRDPASGRAIEPRQLRLF